MAKETVEHVEIGGRRYEVRDTKRSAKQRLASTVNPKRAAVAKLPIPIDPIAPARETLVIPADRTKSRQAAVFHGGRSNKSITHKKTPVIVPMSREEVGHEYRDRALKYSLGGYAIGAGVRSGAESRKAVRPAVAAWDAARGRAKGVVGGGVGRKLLGRSLVDDLTPQEYAQTVRQNAGLLRRLPPKAADRAVHMFGPGDYTSHLKVAGLRNVARFGFPLAGAAAAGLQYAYDRNRKHYRVDYQGR